jgi:membrane protease subunit HflC
VKRLIIVLGVLVGLFMGSIVLARISDNLNSPAVVTREDEQKVILRFGKVVMVTTPGLWYRIPFLDRVTTYDRRWLYQGTNAHGIQTKDGEELQVDNYIVWRIGDAVKFKESFPGASNTSMNAALKRIDRSVRDDVREVIGRHTLTEVLNNKRSPIMTEITSKTRDTLADYGIAVADVRINRTELPAGTENSVYARMSTERERLAKKNRGQGEEQARRIRAEAEREARVLVANARKDSEIARGEGDAKAAKIYADSYSKDPDFYSFVRSLEAYRKTIGEDTTLVLSPNSEFFQFFQSSDGGGKR